MQYRKKIITLSISLSLLNPNLVFSAPFLKFGDSHQQINSDQVLNEQTALIQGSLGIGSDFALGSGPMPLDMVNGTKLILENGITLHKQIYLTDINQLKAEYGQVIDTSIWPNVSLNDKPAEIQVNYGAATFNNMLNGNGHRLIKTGQGSLILNNMANFMSKPFELNEGGLQINGALIGDLNTFANTTVSGLGSIMNANINGNIRPGTAKQIGNLTFNNLNLGANSNTIFRLNDNANDHINVLGAAKLDGNLIIAPNLSKPLNKNRAIISAANLNGTKFKTVQSAVPYLSPKAYYQTGACQHDPNQNCDLVLIGLKHNKLGLNYADTKWRYGLIEDSRFLRDTANSNSATGNFWVRNWFANTEWQNTDRDTIGMQLGKSWRLDSQTHIAAFIGMQNTNWRKGLQLKDESKHLGLVFSQKLDSFNIKFGFAHSQHKANLKRQAAFAEPSIKSKPKANLNQAWLYLQGKYDFGGGNLKPYGQITWLNLQRQRFKEKGGLASVQIAPQTDNIWQSKIGLQLNQALANEYGSASMHTDISINSYITNNQILSKQKYLADPNQSFTLRAKPERLSLELDFGVKTDISKGISIDFLYLGKYGNHNQQHGLWLGAKVGLM